ncbi:glycoside hydrolase family protein [Pseudomonas chlororaphis]|uniref:glycoside hydrolase family protein n=1 Tax=Pseudomonas chlororaphis TaxID=587753 RepID=UPI000BE25F7B|nr:glycoside hydrolase family protein [Pseudomonas chlororaphis]
MLTLSMAGFGAWKASEGFTDHAVIPTKGDVPTLGHGSTHWEDGRPVKITDTITPQRAEILARNLNSHAEKEFAASLPGVKLYQEEFDLYMDFVGQYGIGTWRASSMRRDLLAKSYVQACHDLLKYKYAAGFDCSTPGNKRCWGVWARQLERYSKCMAVQ